MARTTRKRMSRREYAIFLRCQKWGVSYARVRRADVFKRDKWTCQLCGEPIPNGPDRRRWPDPLSPSIDHRLPLSKGGNHEWSNVQASHARCNIVKSNRLGDPPNGEI